MAGETLDYPTYVSFMSSLLVYGTTDPDWVTLLPRMIQAAETRIYRELDLVSTVTTDTASCVAGTPTLTIPASIQIVQSANLITPAVTDPNNGTRNPLQRMSPEFIYYSWPTASETAMPIQYAMLTDTTALVGPCPDAGYKIEFVGILTPSPLSATTTTTFLTEELPDLFIAASAAFGFAFQRDQEGDQTAATWEATYERLFPGANSNAMRQKAQSVSWTTFSPTTAQPPRA